MIFFSPLFLLSDIQVAVNEIPVNGAPMHENMSSLSENEGMNDISHYTHEEIIRVSGLETGENALKYLGGSFRHLIQFRMGKVESRVENLPWVDTAVIHYVYPGTVEIAITERSAIAWIRHMGNYLLVDGEGYVIEVKSELSEPYPEIRGVKLDKFSLGRKIETEEPEKIEGLVQLLKSLEQVDINPYHKLGEVLDWVDFLQEKELYLSLDGRITAKIKLNNELTYRLSYLKELYYNYIKPEERGLIDFFDEKYARFIGE